MMLHPLPCQCADCCPIDCLTCHCLHVCALQVRFVEVKTAKSLEARFPKLYRKQWFRRFCSFINSSLFESIIDALLLLNAIMFAAESPQSVDWNPNCTLIGIMSTYIEAIFSALFVIEVVLKVYVNSWEVYWRKFSNKFDFLVTAATVLASVFVYTPNAYNNSSLIRWFQVLRLLRAVRFLARVQGFKAICGTFIKMLGPAARLLKVLFVLMFVFSALGVQIFGGKINRDPRSKYSMALHERAPDFTSPNPEYDFLAINFNDMWSAMVTLFVLLVVNNWDVMVDGFVAVTSPWLRIFFIAFHFLGVLLCLNIATSFIIDIALEYYGDRDAPGHGVGDEAEIVGNEAVFEAGAVTGTQTGLTGMYRAIMPKQMAIAQDPHELLNRWA